MTAMLEKLLFSQRRVVLSIFAVLTLIMAFYASQLRVDAGFTKLLPMQHEYMQTFSKHQQAFGGANRILIALMVEEGDIFTPEFFNRLAAITDEVFFIPGVERSSVTSLFTPNVRFTEVVEDGIAGGNVIPADFKATPEDLAKVRQNILKAGIVGRLVANDFSGALISVQLQETDPKTGEPLDYIQIAQQLEEHIRAKYQNNGGTQLEMSIHVIGFAKAVGDIAAGAKQVFLFFLIAFCITTALVYWNTRSRPYTAALVLCALGAVVWQLGLVTLLGYGLDPMSVLIPFLIFAIAVSHGVQMVGNHLREQMQGGDPLNAARACFRRLLIPSAIALASDTLGFITIYLIEIQVIQEIAITASIGVAVIILLNLFLLPVLMSYITLTQQQQQYHQAHDSKMRGFWRIIALAATPKYATGIILVSIVLLAAGAWKSTEVKIGDLHSGVPELRAESRYNVDSNVISSRFSIGVDVLNVIVETEKEGCIKYDVMTAIDDFVWAMQKVDGVQSIIALPSVVKTINAGWYEGNPKWRVLPRNEQSLAQSVALVPTSSGLLDPDCSVMPVMIFTQDHKAETIKNIINAVKTYRAEHNSDKIRFMLATGNVGVMAAANEEIERAQFPILVYLFSTIAALCLITFRSLNITLCIMLPLGLVSLLAYALMAMLEIGLKVATLPVVALGAGVGVDYAIYIYSRLREVLVTQQDFYQAYWQTLAETGSGVVFTALTLAMGVATWIFSPLKFQADMGILLTFMFLVNMLGALFLLPALAVWLRKAVPSR